MKNKSESARIERMQDYYYPSPIKRKGLPIYDSFPEFVVDNWSAETRAKGCTKRQNTYLYDSRTKGNDGMYSDRMWQWDAEKMAKAVGHLTNGMRYSTPEEYTAMLTEYVGHPVTVTQVIQMQDGGGFDLWYLAYYDDTLKK